MPKALPVLVRCSSNALMKMNSIVSGAGGAGLLNELDSRANAIFAQSAPVGLDGKQDDVPPADAAPAAEAAPVRRRRAV